MCSRQRLEVLSQLTQARLTLNRLLGRPVDAPLDGQWHPRRSSTAA